MRNKSVIENKLHHAWLGIRNSNLQNPTSKVKSSFFKLFNHMSFLNSSSSGFLLVSLSPCKSVLIQTPYLATATIFIWISTFLPLNYQQIRTSYFRFSFSTFHHITQEHYHQVFKILLNKKPQTIWLIPQIRDTDWLLSTATGPIPPLQTILSASWKSKPK